MTYHRVRICVKNILLRKQTSMPFWLRFSDRIYKFCFCFNSITHIKQEINVHQLLRSSLWQQKEKQHFCPQGCSPALSEWPHLCNLKHRDAVLSQGPHCPAAVLRDTERPRSWIWSLSLATSNEFHCQLRWRQGVILSDLRVETAMVYCWSRLLPFQ